jgi:DNA-binding MarR family transcriptional regulator
MAGLFDRLQDEIERRERNEGLSPMDLLEMEPETRRLVQTLARRGALTSGQIAELLGMPIAEVQAVVDGLVAKGMVQPIEVRGEVRYKAYLARRPGQEIPLGIWVALSDRMEEE